MADNIFSERTTPLAVMVRPTKLTVSETETFSIDDDSILGIQGQVVPDMIEMLFGGFVIQESIVDYLNFSFDTLNNFIVIMGIGVSSSKVTLRHLQAHVLPPFCNEGCERLTPIVQGNRVEAIYKIKYRLFGVG